MSPAPKAPKNSTVRRWEYPEGSGIAILERTNRTGGKAFNTSCRVIVPASVTGQIGHRVEKQCKTLADAKTWAEEQRIAYANHGRSFSELPAHAQRDAITAWAKLSVHGLGFIEAVEEGIKHLRPSGGNKTVAQVIAELVADKEARKARKELRDRSLSDFTLRTTRIKDEFGKRLISSFTETDVGAWLKRLATTGHRGKPLSPLSVRHYCQAFGEIFRHAVVKRYCMENPFNHVSRSERSATMGKKAKRLPPNILTVEQAEKLLKTATTYAEGSLLASAILRLFCGIRTEEIVRLSWKEVRWEEAKPYVHLPETIAKSHAIRNVTIPPNAVEWLTLCPAKKGRLVPHTSSVAYSRAFTLLLGAAGIATKDKKKRPIDRRNVTRHSFGSYHHAMHEDSIETAKEMGHSQGDTVLFGHYRALVTKTEGERFFALSPNAPAKGGVVPFTGEKHQAVAQA